MKARSLCGERVILSGKKQKSAHHKRQERRENENRSSVETTQNQMTFYKNLVYQTSHINSNRQESSQHWSGKKWLSLPLL